MSLGLWLLAWPCKAVPAFLRARCSLEDFRLDYVRRALLGWLCGLDGRICGAGRSFRGLLNPVSLAPEFAMTISARLSGPLPEIR